LIILAEQLHVDGQTFSYNHVPTLNLFTDNNVDIYVKASEKIHIFVDVWKDILSNCDIKVVFDTLAHSSYLTQNLNVSHVKIWICDGYESEAFTPNVISLDFLSNMLFQDTFSCFEKATEQRAWFTHVKKIRINVGIPFLLTLLFPNLEELTCDVILDVDPLSVGAFIRSVVRTEHIADQLKFQPKFPSTMTTLRSGILNGDIEKWYNMGIREIDSVNLPLGYDYSHLPNDLILRNECTVLHGKQHVCLGELI
jgi:hypothetical protein